nr:DUF5677 domain-containing protein [uncultured Xanthomonas sp.]
MSYYSARCQSVNLLLQEWKLWDCDILMRPALECATKYLFVSIAKNPERAQRITECTVHLNEIENIQRSDKARTAANNSRDDYAKMLLGGAVLTPEKDYELRSRWPKSTRQALKQKWSFSEMARALEKFNEPLLNLTSYCSLLHSYGLSSHLIHADQTALDLMHDRAVRPPQERQLLENAHFARLAVDQTALFFVCWRAMAYALESQEVNIDLTKAMLALFDESKVFHYEFAESQRSFYEK